MSTLKDISSEIIRQNWLDYKDEIYDTPYYKLLWDSLENKFNIDKNNMYLHLFKKFINNEDLNHMISLFNEIQMEQIDNDTLVLKGL